MPYSVPASTGWPIAAANCPEQADPGVEIGGEVVGVAHAGQVAGWGGDEVDFRMQARQLVLEHDHGENRSAGGDVAGAHADGVGGDHAGARVAFRRGEDDARLKGAGRVEQFGAFGGERAGRGARHERTGQQVLKLPRLRGDFLDRVESLDELGFVGMGGRVDGEHAGGVAHAEHLLAGELPVHVAGECGDVVHLGDVLLVVEHCLVEVCHGPAFRNVVLEQLGKLLVGFVGVGVLPGAERHEQFAGLVEGEVAVHHGGEADVPHVGQPFAIGGLDVAGHPGVCGLQTLPDFLLGVAPQPVLEMAGPLIVARRDGVVGVIDEHRLDAGGAELDAQARLACADLLGGHCDLLLRHSSRTPCVRAPRNHSVN